MVSMILLESIGELWNTQTLTCVGIIIGTTAEIWAGIQETSL